MIWAVAIIWIPNRALSPSSPGKFREKWAGSKSLNIKLHQKNKQTKAQKRLDHTSSTPSSISYFSTLGRSEWGGRKNLEISSCIFLSYWVSIFSLLWKVKGEGKGLPLTHPSFLFSWYTWLYSQLRMWYSLGKVISCLSERSAPTIMRLPPPHQMPTTVSSHNFLGTLI